MASSSESNIMIFAQHPDGMKLKVGMGVCQFCDNYRRQAQDLLRCYRKTTSSFSADVFPHPGGKICR